MAFASRLDVDFGETAGLTLSLRNARSYPQSISTGYSPIVGFSVTTPDCELVWESPVFRLLPMVHLAFEPREEKDFVDEWSFVDDWGELVPPGDYVVHTNMVIHGVVVPGFIAPELFYTGNLADWDARLLRFRRIHVGEEQLSAVRFEHPPTTVDPSACGDPADETYIRQVMDKYEDTLQIKDFLYGVRDAYLLDENRRPTEVRGIRVVVQSLPQDSSARNLPKCLDGVPVQVVVRPDD